MPVPRRRCGGGAVSRALCSMDRVRCVGAGNGFDRAKAVFPAGGQPRLSSRGIQRGPQSPLALRGILKGETAIPPLSVSFAYFSARAEKYGYLPKKALRAFLGKRFALRSRVSPAFGGRGTLPPRKEFSGRQSCPENDLNLFRRSGGETAQHNNSTAAKPPRVVISARLFDALKYRCIA